MAKQRRIALKLYEWVEKRSYFHKIARKKDSKKRKVWSSIEPSTVKSYSSASGRFSHSRSHIMHKFDKKWIKNCTLVTEYMF